MEKKTISFIEFKEKCENSYDSPKFQDMRKGQIVMNLLARYWMAEYNRITLGEHDKSNLDCFYNDRRIENTFKHLETIWEMYPN